MEVVFLRKMIKCLKYYKNIIKLKIMFKKV